MTTPRPPAPRRLLGACAALALVLAACGDDDGADDPGAVTTDDTADPTATTATTSPAPTPTEPAPTDPADPPATDPPASETTPTEPPATEPPATEPPAPATMGEPQIDVVEVAQLDQPVGLAFRDGDETLYVVEQPGRITAVDPATGEARPVADLTDVTAAQGERGLLGLAFSADGALAYTNHTDAASGATVVSEFAVAPDGTFDLGSRRELLSIDQPYPNHNGGHLVTGPDGLLYVGMGDGGSGGDPERRALDLTDLHGKLLRIDPTPSGDLAYTVPDDNPFVDVADARPEIFAIGLRNPWKFGFDPLTADLWIADVGQNRFEEIHHVPAPAEGVAGAGLSFGWSAFEGDAPFNDDVDPDGHTPPVFTYGRSEGECSISGGAPYRGSAIPELSGGYVYSDFCTGRIWAFDVTDGRNVELAQLTSVTAVLPGPDQELYVVSAAGPVHRIVPAS